MKIKSLKKTGLIFELIFCFQFMIPVLTSIEKNSFLLLEKYIERQEIELTLKLLQKIVPQWKRSSYSDSF